MTRTAAATATIFTELYYENFGRETCEPFRITWSQLRSLAAVPRLEKSFLKKVSEVLTETDHYLITATRSGDVAKVKRYLSKGILSDARTKAASLALGAIDPLDNPVMTADRLWEHKPHKAREIRPGER